jgi:superfamily I DNA/RNA helicase
MVPTACEILNSCPVARNAVRSTYSHVFLDEFQDCTNLQYDLLCTAFGSTPTAITAVGDTKQRIMGWAGALDAVFDRFKADFKADTRYLYQNHRSAPRIRRVGNAMVKIMDPVAAVPDDDLAGDAGIVEILPYDNCASEAADIAGRIQQWIDLEGLAPSQIAVLIRRELQVYAAPLMIELEARGIAYRDESTLQDDFAQPVGQLIVDFLAVMVHTRQADAYRRLMATLTITSGDDEANDRNSARWQKSLKDSAAFVQSISANEGTGDALVAVVRAFLAAVGVEHLRTLSPEYASADRLAEVIDSVLVRVRALADGVGGSLSDLTQVTEDGAVRILTVHKSKGLEFDTVIVLGAEREAFWGKAEEEMATFFVAVSRAERHLVVTAVNYRAKQPRANRRWATARTSHDEFLGYVECGLDR